MLLWFERPLPALGQEACSEVQRALRGRCPCLPKVRQKAQSLISPYRTMCPPSQTALPGSSRDRQGQGLASQGVASPGEWVHAISPRGLTRSRGGSWVLRVLGEGPSPLQGMSREVWGDVGPREVRLAEGHLPQVGHPAGQQVERRRQRVLADLGRGAAHRELRLAWGVAAAGCLPVDFADQPAAEEVPELAGVGIAAPKLVEAAAAAEGQVAETAP